MSRNVEENKVPTVSFNVSGMPDTVFNAWNTSCIEEFGDCRWVKIMNDHHKAKQFDSFIQIYTELLKQNLDLEERIINLETQINNIKSKLNQESERITLG